MADNSMLPQATFNSTGTAVAGTVFGGAFEGPLTCQEDNLTFIDITRPVALDDAIAGLAAGGAATEGHAYLISVGTLQNVIAILYADQTAPTSVVRKVPPLRIPAGVRVFVRAVQTSTSGAAEATVLKLFWKSG